MIEMRFPNLEKHTKLPNIEEEEFDIFLGFLYFGDCSFSLSNLSKLLEMCNELKLEEFKKEILESLRSVHVEELIKLNIKEIEGLCKEMQIKHQEKYGIHKLPSGKAPPPPPLNVRTINKVEIEPKCLLKEKILHDDDDLFSDYYGDKNEDKIIDNGFDKVIEEIHKFEPFSNTHVDDDDDDDDDWGN
jgi:hypothetical protein